MKFRYILISRHSAVMSLVAAAAVALTLFVCAGGGIISTAAGGRLLPIYCTRQDKKIVSLSFDAAWGNEDTQQLIDILAKHKTKATFFIVGQWADKYPESVKALSDAGHEIMNHSDSHPHMPTLSREKMLAEINSCNDKLEKLTGKRPALFRAPYGDYDNALIETLASQSMLCIQWDVDSLDWKDYSAAQIADRVTSSVTPGSICLFHNAAKNTPAALPVIIEKLLADGYTIVPVSKQLCKDNYTINHEGRQIGSTGSQTRHISP